jgi:UPF0148 protein
MPEQSNKNVKKMAELLRSGNTMLNRSCPVCNTPIFRNKEGELFCPSCNRKVMIVDDDSKTKDMSSTKGEVSESAKESKDKKELKKRKGEIMDKTINTIEKKILGLLSEVESEIQLNQLRDYIQVLKELYEFLFFLTKE